MDKLKPIIKKEVEKLFKAILDIMSTEDDECIIARPILLALDLVALHRGQFNVDDFLCLLEDEEEITYYTNLLKVEV